jgi:hypothetical protein
MYGVHTNEEIEQFVDMYIFCNISLLPNPLQNAQQHQHTCTCTKVLLMASIGRVIFNIDDLIIHSALNIHVQQSLSNLPNLSSYSLNKLTCPYE